MAFLGRATRDYRFGLMRLVMDREGYDALAFTHTVVVGKTPKVLMKAPKDLASQTIN